MWKFEEDCLKNVGGDRFLMKLSFFAVLVYAFHKELIEFADFDPLHLKNYFEFSKRQKITGSFVKNLKNKVNIWKTVLPPSIALPVQKQMNSSEIKTLLTQIIDFSLFMLFKLFKTMISVWHFNSNAISNIKTLILVFIPSLVKALSERHTFKLCLDILKYYF